VLKGLCPVFTGKYVKTTVKDGWRTSVGELKCV